jgi:methionyl-tRNA formyltransferase
LTPENINTPEAVAALAALRPDVIAVAAYGQILRRQVLDLPPMGCLNLHGSILPRYRGAAPIQWAIANGDASTGVTVIFMNERMDAGDTVLTREVPILPDDTGGTLSEKMAVVGAGAFVDAMVAVRDGVAIRVPQDDAMATFARKLTKHDGSIDWNMPAEAIHNRVRAFNPWPCGWTILPPGQGGQILRVLRTRVEAVVSGRPGSVAAIGGDGPVVCAGTAGVRLLEVQQEGRRAMGGAEFLRGRPMAIGDMLGGGAG